MLLHLDLGHTCPPAPRHLAQLPSHPRPAPRTRRTSTSFATSPPSSTYHKSVPEVGGSFGGFVGLLLGVGLLLLALLAGLAFLRYRQLQRKLAAHSAIGRSAATGYGHEDDDGRPSTDGYSGRGGAYGEGGVDEEPFELPKGYEGADGEGYGFSAVSLGDGAGGRGGYRDPYAESRSSLVGEEDRRKAAAVYDDLDEAEEGTARR